MCFRTLQANTTQSATRLGGQSALRRAFVLDKRLEKDHAVDLASQKTNPSTYPRHLATKSHNAKQTNLCMECRTYVINPFLYTTCSTLHGSRFRRRSRRYPESYMLKNIESLESCPTLRGSKHFVPRHTTHGVGRLFYAWTTTSVP